MIVPTSTEGRVMLALSAATLDWSVTWTCVDYVRNELPDGTTKSLVQEIEINRGKQSEHDSMEASTAVVYLNDLTGLFNPENVTSPFAGYMGKQIALQAWDPVAGEWVRQTRMWVIDASFDINPATRDGVSISSNVQLHCTDLIGLLGPVAMDTSEAAGNRVFGNVPPVGQEQMVFYEDTSGGGDGMQVRLEQVAADLGLSTDWYSFFTGNVELLEGLYDVGDSPLTVMQDAVDSEFPGIGTLYTDKRGMLQAHGRGAFFDPDTVWAGIALSDAARDAVWKFRNWEAGYGATLGSYPDMAQIKPPLGWSYGMRYVYNVGYCWPADIAEEDKPAQMFVVAGVDPVDRSLWSAEGLLTKEGTTTGETGAGECAKFAEFWATNCAVPKTRVEVVSFRSVSLLHQRAAQTWALMLNADIADNMLLGVAYPGGDVLLDDFYIQGSTMRIKPLNPEMDLVEVSYTVTPKSIYSDDVGLLP